jgi:DNA mismatch repair protein MutL
MNKIILLPLEVSQKIAAGEVIERPSSVVKELVENSLDAEASEIKIDLIDGGKRLIRISDNGQGMSRDDALLCFQRHSTSKIAQEEDLERISTMGFRGEALPSISSVSRVTLETFGGDEESGIRIKREGDRMILKEDAVRPKGTTIEVEDLFFNLPARKKFLRSDRSELGHIVRFLTYVALSFPAVRFSLRHGNRRVFDYTSVSDLKERIYQIYGKSILEKLIEVESTEGEWHIRGYVSRPPTGRADRSHQLFYVNHRVVKDRTIQAAVNQAFRGYTEKDRFAEAFLFLKVPPSEVDVNVHPTKAEIRFKEPQKVFHLVRKGMVHAISREIGIKEVYPQEERRIIGRIEENQGPPVIRFPERSSDRKWEGLVPETAEEEAYPHVLGQYLDTYIVASSEEGILIIDQHNAHERILYEKYGEIDREKRWPLKMTLLPVLFELSTSQILSFEENRVVLEESGFRVDDMGGRSFALKEYPDVFKEEEARQIFLALLEEMQEESVSDKKRAFLATLACKTAVKAGQHLALEKMNYLVEELFKTSNPSLCPHGRPIVLKIDRNRIEKEIRRK